MSHLAFASLLVFTGAWLILVSVLGLVTALRAPVPRHLLFALGTFLPLGVLLIGLGA